VCDFSARAQRYKVLSDVARRKKIERNSSWLTHGPFICEEYAEYVENEVRGHDDVVHRGVRSECRCRG
jgi:hypothetical protein